MKPLAPVPKGYRKIIAWLGDLRDAVIANRILRAERYEVHEHPGGSQLLLDATAITAAAGVTAPFFKISDDSVRSGGSITTARVKLVSSLLCKAEPTAGLTELAVADGDKIYAHVSFNTTTGAVTARVIEADATVPDDDDGEVYLQIGSVTIDGDTLTPTNLIYGPITGCRDWFTEPLSYNLEGSPAPIS